MRREPKNGVISADEERSREKSQACHGLLFLPRGTQPSRSWPYKGKGNLAMKLIIAIVQNADRPRLTTALSEAEIRHTRLNTVGGFLSQGNTTFLIGVDDAKVQDTLDVIAAHCKQREVLHRPGAGALHPDVYASPTYVLVGGATIFIVDAQDRQI